MYFLNKKHLLKSAMVATLAMSGLVNAMLPNPLSSTGMADYSLMDNQGKILADKEHYTQPMSVAIYAFVVQQDVAGQEILLPITPNVVVKQGDIVEYHGYFTNQTGERLRQASLSLDIPKSLEFFGFSTPSNPLASIDGVRFFRTPLKTHINGQMQPIAFRYYRGLRWQVEDIGIGGTAVVKYRAMVKSL